MSIFQNGMNSIRLQSYKKNLKNANGEERFWRKNEKFNEKKENEWGNEGKMKNIGGSGEPLFRCDLNAIDKANNGDLHVMQGEWTK